MLSAREFYNLQKLKNQGKIADNPRASALIDIVTKELAATHPKSSEVDRLLIPNIKSQQQEEEEEPTKLEVAGGSSKSKKRKRRKRKFDESSNRAAAAVISASEVNKKQPSRRRRRRREKAKQISKQSISSAKTTSPESPIEFNDSRRDRGGTKRPFQSPTQMEACPVKKKPSSDRQFGSSITVTTGANSQKSVTETVHSTEDSATSESPMEWIFEDPLAMGRNLFESVISPTNLDVFFKSHFEIAPLLVQRTSPFYDDWLSVRDLDRMLRKHRVMFTEHLDLAIYQNGVRSTPNPTGRAFRSIVWDNYNTGCSIRLLCPQVFFKHVACRLNLLQEYFGCFVGSNVYLTPPGSQGFAPHFDDIDAFILQLEGRKLWRVYAPRNEFEKLPRDPSPNYTEADVGSPILTVTLKAGDLLYLPRGFIHQGQTPPDTHSLHITLSTYQKHTWGDFMLKLMPIALQSAMETDVRFRQGLPVGFLRHLGGYVQNSHPKDPQHSARIKCVERVRREIVTRLRLLADSLDAHKISPSDNRSNLTVTLCAPDPLLTAADLFAVDMIAQSLPPQLDPNEDMCHVQCQGERWTKRSELGLGEKPIGVVNTVELEPDTKIRLVRWSCVRAVRTRLAEDSNQVAGDVSSSEDDGDDDTDEAEAGVRKDGAQSSSLIAVYHSLSNTNVYKEREPEELALNLELLPALDYLVKSFPQFISIEELPLPTIEDRMRAAVGLYECGLVITSEPLSAVDDDDYGDVDDVEEDEDEGEYVSSSNSDSETEYSDMFEPLEDETVDLPLVDDSDSSSKDADLVVPALHLDYSSLKREALPHRSESLKTTPSKKRRKRLASKRTNH